MAREKYVCTGDLVPKDLNLIMNRVDAREGDWHSTTQIEHSMVRVELDIPNACKDLNVRADRTALLRGAQYIADTWLACISFLEGACYSTQIMRIEDSAGCIREFGPRLRFGNEGDDLRVENMELIALHVVQMASTNHRFEMALRDYAAGLRWSQDAAFHCYRALETLCWHYDGNWEDMHSSLGTSRDKINVGDGLSYRRSSSLPSGSVK